MRFDTSRVVKLLAALQPAKQFVLSVARFQTLRRVAALVLIPLMVWQVVQIPVSAAMPAFTRVAFVSQMLGQTAGDVDASGSFSGASRSLFFYQRGTEVTGTYSYSAYSISQNCAFTGTVSGNTLTGKFGPASYNWNFTATFAEDGQSCSVADPWGSYSVAKQNKAIIRAIPTQAILKVGEALSIDGLVGGVADKSIAWSTTGGTIANGSFTAPTTAGLCTVTAESNAQSGVKATTVILVTSDGNLDASGSYAGSLRSLLFYQRGTDVTGTYSYTTYSISQNCAFTGTLSGNTLTGTFGPASYNWNFTATFAEDGQSCSVADPWGSYTVTKQNTAIIRTIPTQAILKVGEALSIDGLVGGVADKSITWSTIGGTIANGAFTAPTTAGLCTVTAESNAQPGLKATTVIQVTTDGNLDASGSYTGSLRSLLFYQRGTEVTGTYSYTTYSISQNCAFTGTLSGNTLTGTFGPASYNWNFTATFAEDGQSCSVADPWGSYTVTKQNTAIIRVIPTQATLKTGEALSIDGLVGGVVDKSITWSATGGTIANGRFTAPTATGCYAVTAESNAQSGVKATTVVQVTTDGNLDVSGSYTGSSRSLLFYQRGTEVTGTYSYTAYSISQNCAFTGTASGNTLTGKFGPASYNWNFTATFAEDGESWSVTDPWGSYTVTKQNTAIIRVIPTQAILKVGEALSIDGLVGGVADKSITWSTTGGAITNGSFTAPATAGLYIVTAESNAQSSVKATTVIQVTTDGNLDASGSYSGSSRSLLFYQRGTGVTGTYSNTTYSTSQNCAFTGTLSGNTLTGRFGPASYNWNLTATFAEDGQSCSVTDPWGSYIVTKQNTAIIRVIPTQAILKVGEALCIDGLVGGVADKSITWSTTGGTIANGSFTAPATAGLYIVTAESNAQSGVKATATIQVTPDGVLDVSGIWSDNLGQTFNLFQNGTQVWGVRGGLHLHGTLSAYSITGVTLFADGSTGNNFVWTFGPNGDTFSGLYGAGTANPTGSWSGTRQPGVVVELSPAALVLRAGETEQFAVQVGGSKDKTVTWSATAGTIVDGLYTAPSGYDYTTQTITVAANADQTKTQSAKVSISPTGVLFISGAYDTGYSTTLVLYQKGTQITGDLFDVARGWTYTFTGTINGYVLTGTTTRIPDGVVDDVNVTYSSDAASFNGNWNAWGARVGANGVWTGSRRVGIASVRITPKQIFVRSNGVVTFTADVAGGANQSVSWQMLENNGGTISSEGEYTAPQAYGTYTVAATCQADPSKTASAIARVQAPVVISPAFVTVQPAGTADFTANLAGFPSGTTVFWRVVESAGGDIDATGKYTAPQEAGTYTVEASALDSDGSTKTATATVTVLFAITITPNRPVVGTGQQKQFTSTLTGSANKSVTWSVEPSNAGTIDSIGLFTAANLVSMPSVTPVTIRATSVARPTLSGTADVTVMQTVCLTPATATVDPESQQTFVSTVTGLASSDVVWSATGGTITGGLYTAPTMAGVYTVQATSKVDSRFVGQATITVPVRLTVSPSGSVLIPAGVPVQFLSTVKGAADKRVHWSLSDTSFGTINNFDSPAVVYGSSGGTGSSSTAEVVRLNGTPYNPSDFGVFFGKKAGVRRHQKLTQERHES